MLNCNGALPGNAGLPGPSSPAPAAQTLTRDILQRSSVPGLLLWHLRRACPFYRSSPRPPSETTPSSVDRFPYRDTSRVPRIGKSGSRKHPAQSLRKGRHSSPRRLCGPVEHRDGSDSPTCRLRVSPSGLDTSARVSSRRNHPQERGRQNRGFCDSGSLSLLFSLQLILLCGSLWVTHVGTGVVSDVAWVLVSHAARVSDVAWVSVSGGSLKAEC